MLISSNDSRPNDWDRAYLRFHRYGQSWILREVLSRGLAQELPATAAEKEIVTAQADEERIFAVVVNR
jgi:hypothetical protein